MTDPITDVETVSEEPSSFEPADGSGSKVNVTIAHHNGEVQVSDFEKIEEISMPDQKLRVWYDMDAAAYNDYYGARITDVQP